MRFLRRQDLLIILLLTMAWSVVSVLAWLTLGESRQIHEHRIRNESHHTALCHRQDQIAERLRITFAVPCPKATIIPEGD